jgi:hypothetical protein
MVLPLTSCFWLLATGFWLFFVSLKAVVISVMKHQQKTIDYEND